MYYCKRCHTWHKSGNIARSHKIYADITRKPKKRMRTPVKKTFTSDDAVKEIMKLRNHNLKKRKTAVVKKKKIKHSPEKKRIVSQMNKEFNRMIAQSKPEPIVKPRPMPMLYKPKPVYRPKQKEISQPRRAKLTREIGSLKKLDLFRKKMRTYSGYIEKEKDFERMKEWKTLKEKEQIDKILVGRRKQKAYQMLKKYHQTLKSDPGFELVEFEKYGGSNEWMYEMRYGGEFVTAKKQFQTPHRILI